MTVARTVLRDNGIAANQVAAVGITNQRETTVLWDRHSGQPLHRAIVWQDRRTAGLCDSLAAAGHAELFRERTGLVLDAYFSGTKLKWLLDHVPGARARAGRGELAFGTIDSWLAWKLSGGRVHVTYTRNSTVMLHAVSLATNADLYYNPLQPCVNSPNLPASFGDWAADFVVPAPTTVLDDLDTLRALRDLFATTPDGQHFIDLYYTYAAETGTMALNDPALALEAYAVMQSLLPGFEALVRGHGDDVHVTADMIAQANALLDELTGAGSPQLAAALATERARFNQLADFEGLTFAQASALLGVTPPGLVYLTELSR